MVHGRVVVPTRIGRHGRIEHAELRPRGLILQRGDHTSELERTDEREGWHLGELRA